MPEFTPEQMRVFRETLEAQALANAAAVPLDKHGAFDDLRAYLEFIQLGADALKGIGAMLLPETHDNQLNMAFASEASAVFRFFGEALTEAANNAYDAKERLERAARGELS